MIEVESYFNLERGFCFEEDGGILVNDSWSKHDPEDRPSIVYQFRGSPTWRLYLADEAHLDIRGRYTIRDGNNNAVGGHWISPRIAQWQTWILGFEDRLDAQRFKLKWM